MKISAPEELQHRDSGLTLVEVLVAMAIVSIIVGAMGFIFERSSRVYTTQNATARLQQEVRAALDIIKVDALMAGYDRLSQLSLAQDLFVVMDATRMRIRADRDGDGSLADAYNSSGECENRSYRYQASQNAVQILCGEGTASQEQDFLIGGLNFDGSSTDVQVTALSFDYRDEFGNTVLPTRPLNEIRGVTISITAQLPAGRAGMVQRTYTTQVDFRNVLPNLRYGG